MTDAGTTPIAERATHWCNDCEQPLLVELFAEADDMLFIGDHDVRCGDCGSTDTELYRIEEDDE